MSRAVFTVREGVVRAGDRVLLGPVSLSTPDRAVTVILGPAGAGKSTLMNALAGTLPAELVARGKWQRPATCTLIAQRPRTRALYDPSTDAGSITRAALESGVEHLLLDEPSRGMSEQAREDLIARVRAHRARGSAIVITHDLDLARRLADRAILVVDGQLEADCEASVLFDSPPTERARHFVKHGNCPSIAVPTPLPAHLRWVEPGALAGMGMPGLLRDAETDLRAISDAGITMLVSLTETPFPPGPLRELAIASFHLPIPDMGAPSIALASRACKRIESEIARGGVVAVHCRAGVGRTGTILAAYLIWRGATVEDALSRLRAVQGRYVESRAQELFLHSFAEASRQGSG